MKKTIIICFLFITATSAFSQDDASYKATLKKMLESAGREAAFKSAIKQMFVMFRQQKSNVPLSFGIHLKQNSKKRPWMNSQQCLRQSTKSNSPKPI